MVNRNGRKTRETGMIEKVLKDHFPDYPKDFPPAAYRYNPASIRVRLIHKSFKGKSLSEREDMVLPVIRTLPEKTQADIMVLLLLSPSEVDRSAGNVKFEMPSPSKP